MTAFETRNDSEPVEPGAGRWVRRGRTIVVLAGPGRSRSGARATDVPEHEAGATDVRQIQTSLNRILGLTLAVDGIAGPYTRAAIADFQRRQGLTPDGVVGPRTAAALQAALEGGAQGGGSAPAAQAPPSSGNLPAAWSTGPVNPPRWSPTVRGYGSIACGPRSNGLVWIPDNLRPESVSTGWTPRTAAIANLLRGPLFGWKNVGGAADGGRSGHVASSYHYCGRAIDAFPPGVAWTQPATGAGLSAGWRAANWAAHNAAVLSVSEVIFYDRIWTAARGAEGWRPYTHPGGQGDPNTLQHRDHVHISVY